MVLVVFLALILKPTLKEAKIQNQSQENEKQKVEIITNYFKETKTEFPKIEIRYKTLVEIEKEKQQQVLIDVSYKPVNYNVEQWHSLVSKYFPANQVDNALRIMQAESGGNPNNISPTNDHGLFQINARTWSGYTDLDLSYAYDPETNVRIASYIYNCRGWSPWSVSKRLGL